MMKSRLRVSSATYTDKQLVDMMMQRGEAEIAIHHIYTMHASALIYTIQQMGASRPEAEDILQDAVVALMQAVKNRKYLADSSLKTFLYAIAKNLWFTAIRKKSNTAKHEEKFSNSVDKEVSLEDSIHSSDQLNLIYSVFDRLGAECKKLLLLFYYENLSMREILDSFDLDNEQVLRNKKYKCMNKLSRLMDENPVLKVQLKEALQKHG